MLAASAMSLVCGVARRADARDGGGEPPPPAPASLPASRRGTHISDKPSWSRSRDSRARARVSARMHVLGPLD